MTSQNENVLFADPELVELMSSAGLSPIELLGEWDGTPFHPKSREIIPIGCQQR